MYKTESYEINIFDLKTSTNVFYHPLYNNFYYAFLSLTGRQLAMLLYVDCHLSGIFSRTSPYSSLQKQTKGLKTELTKQFGVWNLEKV